MRQTTMAKPNEVVRQWYIVDGTGLTLGRLSSEVATVLRGKHRPTYTPNVDTGDFVIIINADKIVVTGDQTNKKFYYAHSQFAGGMRKRSTRTCVNSIQLNGLKKPFTVCCLTHAWEIVNVYMYSCIQGTSTRMQHNNQLS